MKLTILGSCSGTEPMPGRHHTSFVIEHNEAVYWFDAGENCAYAAHTGGIDLLATRAIFISHTHSDHCCELSLVIQMLHVLRSDRRLDIFVPDEFVRPLLAWLNAVYLFPQHITPDLHIHGYADQFIYNGDDFTLSAIANRHLEKSLEIIEQYDLPNRMQCHSFRIKTAGKKILYSADLGSLDDISSHLDDLDCALIESTHVELESLIDLARQSPELKIVLTHLGNEVEISSLLTQIGQSGLNNISLASDGLRLPL